MIAFFHCYHILLLEQKDWIQTAYFLFYTIVQAFLEVSLMVLLAHFIQKYAPKFLWLIFVSLTSICLIFHLVEFPLMRIMGISIWYAIEMVMDESFENFIEMLHATHISLTIWILIATFIGGFIWGGIVFCQKCEKWSRKRPLFLNYRGLAFACGCFPFFILGMDHFTLANINTHSIGKFQQALPWKKTFLTPKTQNYPLEKCLRPFSGKKIGELDLSLEEKPDLFLFVVESLRKDFISEDIAPNFWQFKTENVAPEGSFASGNGTQLSWFSIFFSKFPFYFSEQYPSGSLSLQCLKKLGYEINVISSSRLNYYRMDEVILGRNRKLVNQFHFYPPSETKKAFESDRETISKLLEMTSNQEEKGGRCFIIFLESTHFDYSWPKEKNSKFLPYAEPVNYLKLAFSRSGLEKIKNRFRNAISYVDDLFGEFQNHMQNTQQWEEAVIAVTGDHGEEFFEEGRLFHASNLNEVQTSVPIYFKFGKKELPTSHLSSVVSHVDIFPTFFHYLLGDMAPFNGLFDGQSIFDGYKWPYSVSCRYNGSRRPHEFLIQNETQKLLVRFNQKPEIFRADALQILDWQSEDFKDLIPALDRLFSH